MNKTKLKKYSFITAIILALFMVVGIIYDKYSSIFIPFTKPLEIIDILISFIFWCSLFWLVIFSLYSCLDNYKYHNPQKLSIFRRHPFLSIFILTFSISLIYFVIFYPGIVTWDGFWQLDMYYGIRAMSNHHPAFLSVIMGLLADLGRFLINDNFGISLFIIIQMLFNAFVYSYTIKVLSKLKIPNFLYNIIIIFYAAFPLLSLYSVTYIKDTLFYLTSLLIFVFQYNNLVLENNHNKSTYIILTLLYILLILLRNTGIYIVVISLITLILYYRKKVTLIFKRISIIFGIVIVFQIGYNILIYQVLDVNHASVREMLSIPLQQTARYLKNYPDDLNEEEKEAIDNLFTVDINELGKLYNPNKSDPIKWKFKSNATTEELLNYFKAWFTMFLKHPGTYVDATLNNTYGYFYPGMLNSIEEGLGFFEIEDNTRVNAGYLDISFNTSTHAAREFIYNMSDTLSKIPILGKIYYCSTYTWALIAITIYLLYKRYHELLVYCAPLYMGIIVCLISPLNAHMRYLIPVAICIPVLIAFVFHRKANAKK